MRAEEVKFFNGDIRLAGTFYVPAGDGPHPVMIVLHAAAGGTRTYPFYQHLASRLPEQGIGVFLFDRRGSGESSGKFETANFATLAEDGASAFEYLRSRQDVDAQRLGVYGISQGGWIVPIIAARKVQVAFLIVVSGSGVSPADQMDYAAGYTLREAGFSDEEVTQAIGLRKRINEYFRGHLPRQSVQAEIEKARHQAWYLYTYIGDEDLPLDVTQDKWYYELDYDPLPIWRQVIQPTLFLFGEHDRWVPVEESISNYQAATSHIRDVTLEKIEGVDHLMGKVGVPETDQVSERYFQRLSGWLQDRLSKIKPST